MLYVQSFDNCTSNPLKLIVIPIKQNQNISFTLLWRRNSLKVFVWLRPNFFRCFEQQPFSSRFDEIHLYLFFVFVKNVVYKSPTCEADQITWETSSSFVFTFDMVSQQSHWVPELVTGIVQIVSITSSLLPRDEDEFQLVITIYCFR